MIENKNIIAGIVIILIILIVWGLVGSSQVAKIGNTCDFGMGKGGSVFCWKWHQNTIGDFSDAIEEIFDK